VQEVLPEAEQFLHPFSACLRLTPQGAIPSRAGFVNRGRRLGIRDADAAAGRTRTELVLLIFFDEEMSIMRSNLIYGALTHVKNRYQLCQLASKATRKLHKPNTRLQDTMNEVLYRFRSENPMAPVARATESESVRKQERRAA